MEGGSENSEVLQQAPQTSEAQAAQASEPKQERMFTQSELNEIVGRAKAEAVERARRAEERQKQTSNQNPDTNMKYDDYSQNTHTQAPQASFPEDQYRQMAKEEFDRQRQEWEQSVAQKAHEREAQRVAQNFFTKLSEGAKQYPDFDKEFAEFDFGAIPDIVHLATNVDNVAGVMYELKKNPSKIGTLRSLIQINPENPSLAMQEMKKLSDSVQRNEQSPYDQEAPAPLTQIKSSTNGMDSGAPLTVADYKKKYRG